MMVIMTGVRWYWIVFLICLSLIIINADHLLMCLLVIYMPSLEEGLFRFSAYFSIVFFFFLQLLLLLFNSMIKLILLLEKQSRVTHLRPIYLMGN